MMQDEEVGCEVRQLLSPAQIASSSHLSCLPHPLKLTKGAELGHSRQTANYLLRADHAG
jgi:hypothetical protein